MDPVTNQADVCEILSDLTLGEPVCIKQISPTIGKGVFSKSTFTASQIIHHELPLFLMQDTENRHQVLVCSHCFKWLGNIEMQLEFLANKRSRQSMHLSSNSNPYKLAKKIPLFAHTRLSNTFVRCSHGCDEYYCSERCMKLHYEQSHKLFCPNSPLLSADCKCKLQEFLNYATKTDEAFMQVGFCLSRIMCSFLKNGGDLTAAQHEFKQFVSLPWWEVRPCRHQTADAEHVHCECSSVLKKQISKACVLLKDAICQSGCEYLFELDVFASYAGMFEMNCMGVEVTNPAEYYFRLLAKYENQSKEDSVEGWKEMNEIITDILLYRREQYRREQLLSTLEHPNKKQPSGNCSQHLEADEVSIDTEEDLIATELRTFRHCNHQTPPTTSTTDGIACSVAYSDLKTDANDDDNDIFPRLSGYALFPIICTMNHSCKPNASVLYEYPIKAFMEYQVRRSFSKSDLEQQFFCNESITSYSTESSSMKFSLVDPLDFLYPYTQPLCAFVFTSMPISIGNEILQCYCDKTLSVEERQTHLFGVYHFLCGCPRCQAENASKTATDN